MVVELSRRCNINDGRWDGFSAWRLRTSRRRQSISGVSSLEPRPPIEHNRDTREVIFKPLLYLLTITEQVVLIRRNVARRPRHRTFLVPGKSYY
jgi:hypothetical protein